MKQIITDRNKSVQDVKMVQKKVKHHTKMFNSGIQLPILILI